MFPVNIPPSRFTLDAIGEIAFGTSINSLHDENVPFAKAFNVAQVSTAERGRNPLYAVSLVTT